MVYHVFTEVKDLDVGDIKSSQRFDLILSQIHLIQLRKVTQALQVGNLIPPQLQLLQLGMPSKGLNLLNLVLNQTQLR